MRKYFNELDVDDELDFDELQTKIEEFTNKEINELERAIEFRVVETQGSIFALTNRQANCISKPKPKPKNNSQNKDPFLANACASASPSGKRAISSPLINMVRPIRTKKNPVKISPRFWIG